MNEYQTAMVALQETSVALQQAGLTLQEAALAASHWHTAITLAVSSCLVLYGFRIMRQSTDARNAALQADQEQRHQEHAETMQRMDREHAETMQRMDREHAETMRRMDQQHAEATDALHTIIHGLETTIERTAPKEGGTRAGV